MENIYDPWHAFGSSLIEKSFCDSKKHLEEINADGFKVHNVFDGYLYDDLELELTNVKTEEESTDLIHYSPDFKRWIQGISVCVEAMGHNYSPDCVLYISDINNYEGFNYKNSNIWDNYRKNIYKFFIMYQQILKNYMIQGLKYAKR